MIIHTGNILINNSIVKDLDIFLIEVEESPCKYKKLSAPICFAKLSAFPGSVADVSSPARKSQKPSGALSIPQPYDRHFFTLFVAQNFSRSLLHCVKR